MRAALALPPEEHATGRQVKSLVCRAGLAAASIREFRSRWAISSLRKATCFLECQPRIAGEEIFIRAVTDGADEIGFDMRTGEELGIHRAVVKARHGPAVQPQGARRHHQICALKTTI